MSLTHRREDAFPFTELTHLKYNLVLEMCLFFCPISISVSRAQIMCHTRANDIWYFAGTRDYSESQASKGKLSRSPALGRSHSLKLSPGPGTYFAALSPMSPSCQMGRPHHKEDPWQSRGLDNGGRERFTRPYHKGLFYQLATSQKGLGGSPLAI